MIPNIAYWHPPIAHFVVALLIVGVILRLISLSGRLAFTGPAAALLLLAGTGAAVLAVQSGNDAHGPVERIPGVRNAVTVHEDAGHDTRNVFLVVAALELAALALHKRKANHWLLIGSGLVGLGGLWPLYEVAGLGGELVYKYAGGVGTRYGDSTDVSRLLLAGFYQQAMSARAAKRPLDAAAAVDEMVKRFPGNITVQLMQAESALLDRKDGRGALAVLAAIAVPADSASLRTRYAYIKSDAYGAAGVPDSARATLEALSQAYPNNARIKQRLEQLKK